MIPKLIIDTEINKREKYAQNILRELGFRMNHPDLLWFGPEEKLGIEQAKKIKDFLNLKPFQGQGQVIVIISAQNLTLYAQNALLKILEEHADGVTFILGIAAEDQLLATINSRCQIINLPDTPQSDGVEKDRQDIEKLLDSTIAQRFQFIEKLKEKEEFLPALTSYFRHKLLEISLGGITVPPPRWTTMEILQNFLKELIEAERWAKANVNIRAILEYLMLKMPGISN